jgi:hypothetical protein
MLCPTFLHTTLRNRTVRFLSFIACLGILALPMFGQSSSDDKPFDVRSSVGDLHVGKDADAQKAGLPVYPGARPKKEKDNDPLNVGILTEAFGLQLVVAKYESDDSPAKILNFYREKLKRYGKVLECHSHDDGVRADANSDDDKDDHHSKELKCEGDNTGPVTELKAGTEDDQHVVAIEPCDDSKRSTTFVIVYVHSRGKRGEV